MDTRELDQQKTVTERKGNGTGTAAGPSAPTTRQKSRSRPRKRIVFVVGAVVVIAAALIWGMPWLTYMLSHEGTDDAHVAADEVAVTSKIPERIDQILVDTNQQVRRGQLLIVLDNKDELAEASRGAGAVRSRRREPARDHAAGPRRRLAGERGDRQRAGASAGRASRRRASRARSCARRRRKCRRRSRPTIKLRPITRASARW